jgi:uncharacterized protein (DUF427 family)
MKAIWNDVVLAASDSTVVVEGNHYFPRDSIKEDYFRANDLRTVCGWKGEASYYDIVVDDQVNDGAAWTYADTLEATKNIEG